MTKTNVAIMLRATLKGYAFGLVALLILGFEADAGSVQDAHPQLNFRHLSTKNGLSQNSVYSLTQDIDGFIWIATQAGLERYDGTDIVHYRAGEQASYSLPSNFVAKVAADRSGGLWVGTIPPTISYRPPNEAKFYTLALSNDAAFIRDILPDDAQAWVATEDGLYRIEAPLSGKKTQVTFPILNGPFQAVLAHQQHIIAINTTRIYRFPKLIDMRTVTDDELKKFLIYRLPDNTEGVLTAGAVGQDTLWLGSSRGQLIEFNLKDKTVGKTIDLPAASPHLSRSIMAVAVQDKIIWVGTKEAGLFRYDTRTGTTTHYQSQMLNPTTLSDNRIYSLLIDRQGLLWVGTSGHGVDRANTNGSNFRLYRSSLKSNDFSFDNDIRALVELADGRILAATKLGRLVVANETEATLEPFGLPVESEVNRLSFGPASLIKIDENTLIYGSGAGLWFFDINKKAFAPAHPDLIQISILVAKKMGQQIWLGSNSHGLGVYDLSTHKTQWIFDQKTLEKQLGSTFIAALAPDPERQVMYVGTSVGLFRFSPSTTTLEPITRSDGTPLGFIRHLYLNGNTLWIGTLSGLYRVPDVNIEPLHVERMFGDIEPLQGNIYAIQQDSEGALWIATNRGLTRIFPDTGDFRHFSSADGLQSEEFNGDASLLDSQGRMWFAGPSGVNSFVPGNFSISDFEPPVWFTAIKTSTQHKTIHLPALFKSITLGPSEDMLSVRFAALDYTSPERIQYRIRMNNEQWVDIGHHNEIAYANLAPGRYILQVAASNADGRFGGHFRALRIDITPPWWQTTSAYLVYFLIVMLLIWGYIQWRRQKLGESLEHQREIRRAKRMLEWALWGTGDALWVWDLTSNRTKRIGLEKLLGYQENELTDESSHLEWLVHPEDLPKVDELIQKHLTHPESSHFEAEYRMRAADGSWRWILDRGRVVERDEQGRPLRVAGTFRDITDRKKTEEELKLFALVIRNMSEMVVVTDANLRILSFNPAFQTTLAVDSDKLEGQNLSEFIAPIRTTNRIVSWQKDIAVAGHWSGELTIGPATEKARYVWAEMTAIFDTQKALRYVVCVMTDLTDQKKAEAELHYLTHFDHLTQLPNRLMFMELLEKAVAKARRTKHCVGVLLIDLDNFKHVNDSLGHDAGDLLLQAFAQRMKDAFSSQYKLCRLGGDEFAIIAEHFKTGDSLQTLLQEIRALIATPFNLNGQDVNITVSIGISLYPDDAEDARSLLKYADTAVHAAKSSGRNAYQFYSHDMNQRITRRLEIEAALRHALTRHEFSLVYQPKFDLINGTITGVEALLRWKSQQIGDVRPDEFIPIAEETGLIDDIGTWVFDRACQDALTWQAQLNEPLNIAINLSPRQFKSHDLVEQLQQSLQKHNLSATQFTLEITETLLMENAQQTIHICDSLKALGFQLSIDDFGTGYSSLSYLKRFPIDSLKIDRSFVRDIIDDMDDAAITSAIIGLAHNLALVVVAEGVETAQQLVFLRASGCDEIQGYLISPPTTAEDVIRIVESARRGEFNRFFHH